MCRFNLNTVMISLSKMTVNTKCKKMSLLFKGTNSHDSKLMNGVYKILSPKVAVYCKLVL